jgi:hypothetical protein
MNNETILLKNEIIGIIEIIVIIVIIFIVYTFMLSNKKENYYNQYGDYLDSPFMEKDDKECKFTCMRMSDCKGYSYDPTKGSCYLHNGKNEYIYPYSDHFLYPYYDDYLYKYAWWLYGKYDSPPIPKVLAEEGKSFLPENDDPKTLEIINKSRPILKNTPRWTNEQYFNKGYRGTMYRDRLAHHIKPENHAFAQINGGDESRIGADHGGRSLPLGYGRANNYIGGGHGGRVRGSIAGLNAVEYAF